MLLTKLHIPQPKENVVHRSALFEKLDEGLTRKLILVSATAGYGKTTLVGDWINHSKIPTAWYSLDNRDNDPYEFLTFIITGIQSIHKNVGNKSLDLLKSPGTTEVEYIIELLINDILTIKGDFLLVIDDFHLIDSKEVHEIIGFLTDYKPGNFKLAILTRSDPPLSLARLRSQNELMEIRTSDLSFSEHDISDFFNRKLKLGLTKKDINLVELKTEGWIAGLQLTAITLRNKENVSEFINSIAGDSRYIMDYLLEEILNNLDDEIRLFLLKSSLFEQLSGPLCDAALGISNSQKALEYLERNNLFIIPLDDERKWFRYHHLFSDLLQKRLISGFKDKIHQLHDNASLWFENNNMPLFAIEHALKAGNNKKGLELLEERVDQMLECSQYAAILKFAALFEEQEIIESYKFGISYAWTLTITGNLVKAENYLKKLESNVLINENSQSAQKYLSRIYLTFNLIATYKGKTEDAVRYSNLALRNIDESDFVWSSFAYYLSAGTYILKFELDKCIESLSKGWDSAKRLDNSYLEIINPAKIAYLLKLKGRFSEALKICDELLKTYNSKSASDEFKLSLFASFIYLTKGSLLIEKDEIEEGFQMVLKGYNLSQKLTGISFKIYGVLVLAESYYKIGEEAKALEIIENFGTDLNKNENHWLFVLVNALYFKLLTIKKIEEADVVFERIKNKNLNTFQFVFYNISVAHYLLAKRKFEEFYSLVSDLIPFLAKKEGFQLLTELQVLKVKALDITNQNEEAKAVLLESILQAQSEGIIRIFVNAGTEIECLLKEIKKEKATRNTKLLNAVDSGFLNRVLNAFSKENKIKQTDDGELLSNRELDTLKLIANNLTNQQIADELYISLNTVKTHLKNINLKLEVDSRIKAVEKAKTLGII